LIQERKPWPAENGRAGRRRAVTAIRDARLLGEHISRTHEEFRGKLRLEEYVASLPAARCAADPGGQPVPSAVPGPKPPRVPGRGVRDAGPRGGLEDVDVVRRVGDGRGIA